MPCLHTLCSEPVGWRHPRRLCQRYFGYRLALPQGEPSSRKRMKSRIVKMSVLFLANASCPPVRLCQLFDARQMQNLPLPAVRYYYYHFLMFSPLGTVSFSQIWHPTFADSLVSSCQLQAPRLVVREMRTPEERSTRRFRSLSCTRSHSISTKTSWRRR